MAPDATSPRCAGVGVWVCGLKGRVGARGREWWNGWVDVLQSENDIIFFFPQIHLSLNNLSPALTPINPLTQRRGRSRPSSYPTHAFRHVPALSGKSVAVSICLGQ